MGRCPRLRVAMATGTQLGIGSIQLQHIHKHTGVSTDVHKHPSRGGPLMDLQIQSIGWDVKHIYMPKDKQQFIFFPKDK